MTLEQGVKIMMFDTMGNSGDPAVLFFHAMGVTGRSSMPVAEHMKEKYFCIMPTSTVYCEGQIYSSKDDEIRQIEEFLMSRGVGRLSLVAASSIGADLAMAFLTESDIKAEHVFFDGGQFAQINGLARAMMAPVIYSTIRGMYRSQGANLKQILWCDDEAIKPYFIEAGKNVTYRDIRRQLSESLTGKPFPELPRELQEHTFWEFGSIEDHFKYRDAVMDRYRHGRFPVFEGMNHMQYQIRDPEGFALMLESVIEKDELPELPFLREE